MIATLFDARHDRWGVVAYAKTSSGLIDRIQIRASEFFVEFRLQAKKPSVKCAPGQFVCGSFNEDYIRTKMTQAKLEGRTSNNKHNISFCFNGLGVNHAVAAGQCLRKYQI